MPVKPTRKRSEKSTSRNCSNPPARSGGTAATAPSELNPNDRSRSAASRGGRMVAESIVARRSTAASAFEGYIGRRRELSETSLRPKAPSSVACSAWPEQGARTAGTLRYRESARRSRTHRIPEPAPAAIRGRVAWNERRALQEIESTRIAWAAEEATRSENRDVTQREEDPRMATRRSSPTRSNGINSRYAINGGSEEETGTGDPTEGDRSS